MPFEFEGVLAPAVIDSKKLTTSWAGLRGAWNGCAGVLDCWGALNGLYIRRSYSPFAVVSASLATFGFAAVVSRETITIPCVAADVGPGWCLVLQRPGCLFFWWQVAGCFWQTRPAGGLPLLAMFAALSWTWGTWSGLSLTKFSFSHPHRDEWEAVPKHDAHT